MQKAGRRWVFFFLACKRMYSHVSDTPKLGMATSWAGSSSQISQHNAVRSGLCQIRPKGLDTLALNFIVQPCWRKILDCSMMHSLHSSSTYRWIRSLCCFRGYRYSSLWHREARKASLIFSVQVYLVRSFAVHPIFYYLWRSRLSYWVCFSVPGQVSWDGVFSFSNLDWSAWYRLPKRILIGLIISGLASGNWVRGEKGNCLGASTNWEFSRIADALWMAAKPQVDICSTCSYLRVRGKEKIHVNWFRFF